MKKIIFAEGAEANGLAGMLSQLIQQNVEQSPKKRNEFEAIDCSIALCFTDVNIAITLDFKKGGWLTIYDGIFGEPDVRIDTKSDAMMEMGQVPKKYGIPWFFDKEGMEMLKKMREVKVSKSAVCHMLPLMHFTRLMSV